MKEENPKTNRAKYDNNKLNENSDSHNCLPSFLIKDLVKLYEESEDEIEIEEEEQTQSNTKPKLNYNQCYCNQRNNDVLHQPQKAKNLSFDTLNQYRQDCLMMSPYNINSLTQQHKCQQYNYHQQQQQQCNIPQLNHHLLFQFCSYPDYGENFQKILQHPHQTYSTNTKLSFPNQAMILPQCNNCNLKPLCSPIKKTLSMFNKNAGSKLIRQEINVNDPNMITIFNTNCSFNHYPNAKVNPNPNANPTKNKKQKKTAKMPQQPLLQISFFLKLLDNDLYSYVITQKGSREFQTLLKKAKENEVEALLNKLLLTLPDIMIDKYGNYFSQRLIQICSLNQRIALLKMICPRFVEISCNSFGTHPLQSLIEIVNLSQERDILVQCIEGNEVVLSLDSMGTHVIQKFISCTSEDQRETINNNLLDHISELINDSFGVCVMIKLMKHSTSFHLKERISIYISKNNPLSLIQGPFSNYVVKNLFNKTDIVLCKDIITVIIDNFFSLSLQKYSSNVVENCIKYSEEGIVIKIYDEVITQGKVGLLINDTYGGFVMEKLVSRLNKKQKAEIIKEVQKLGKEFNLSSTLMVLLSK